MRMLFFVTLVVASLLGLPLALHAQPAGESPWVASSGITDTEPTALQQRLVASHSTATLGQEITLAWEFAMQPEWHLYWQNAGDSGLPPELRSSANTVLPLVYPVPEVISIPPVTNYGYKTAVTFTAPYTVPTNLPTGAQTLRFKAEFLYCKDVCLPGTATLELPLTIGTTSTANPAFKPVQNLPQAIQGVTASRNGLAATLSLPHSAAGYYFAPSTEGVLEDSAPQTVTGNQLNIKLDNQAPSLPATLKGLLLKDGQGYSLETPLPLGAAPNTQVGLSAAFLFALLSAFLAGLILNLMPCVLPVLSLKVLSLVKHHTGPARIRHAMAYTAGVVGSFWVFAAVIFVLQLGGASVGWGFHLQQPLVVAGLTLLMMAVALNFFGVFELGHALTRLAGSGNDDNLLGSASTGALAVLVATPCTVPFMGGALGYALTQTLAASFAVFTLLGLGMALPFLLLALYPAALKRLPKPGQWMVTFKHALGWPMLATALWLAFVYNSLTSQIATFALLGLALLLALGLWLYGQKSTLLRGCLLAAVVSLGIFGLARLNQPTSSNWQVWAPAAVAEAQAAGRPVFIDFTADWCLTCKVTEATVLNTSAAQALFTEKNVTLFKADWTKQDATITAELAKHGRKGVPLYVLYLPNQATPQVLPQLLSVGVLAEALNSQ